MKRRDFLKLSGMGLITLATPRGLFAMGHTMGDVMGNIDPRDVAGFVNPLKRPGHHGGLLGYLDPHGPFTIRALPARATVLPGKSTDLLVYGVKHGRTNYVNPILTVRKGGRLIPTLQNDLDASTIIHWHGLIVDSKNDGIPSDAIASGDKYKYDFTVRNRAGTYWYHPHPDGLTSKQAYLGMASFFIVEDDDELRLRRHLDLVPGHTDIPLVLQDKRFDASGAVLYNPTEEEKFMGFLGDTILANLTVKPYLDVATRIYRFRLLNGSNARTYRLALVTPDGNFPFSLIGTDGGLLPKPASVTELFLSPGERADILVDLSGLMVGESLHLKSLPFDPMDNEQMADGMVDQPSMGLANGEEFYIMKLNVKRKIHYHCRIPDHLSLVDPLNVSAAMMRQMNLAQVGPDVMKWSINGETFDLNRISFEVERNSVEVWEIMNDMMGMPHPMHIHGFQFQVLDRQGSPQQTASLAVDGNRLPTDLGWKDTVLIWPGETVRIAIDFSIPYPGPQQYVFHCHNLEHEDEGMMVNYKVI